MKKIKVLALVLALVMSFSLLTACGGGGYKDDVALSTLAETIDGALGSENKMATVPESYLSTYFKIDGTAFSEYLIKINAAGINVDEYGIFKAKDKKQAEELKASVESFFAYRKDIWMPEYMPEELPKLTEAEVNIYGNYVVYGILNDSTKKAVFSAVEELLKA